MPLIIVFEALRLVVLIVAPVRVLASTVWKSATPVRVIDVPDALVNSIFWRSARPVRVSEVPLALVNSIPCKSATLVSVKDVPDALVNSRFWKSPTPVRVRDVPDALVKVKAPAPVPLMTVEEAWTVEPWRLRTWPVLPRVNVVAGLRVEEEKVVPPIEKVLVTEERLRIVPPCERARTPFGEIVTRFVPVEVAASKRLEV
jgi:hypothetical protein